MLGSTCPKCGSQRIRWPMQSVGSSGVGSLAGAALGSSGLLAGSEAGAALGIAGGPAGILIGGVAGALIGALIGGCQHQSSQFECLDCGHRFSP